MVINAKPMMVRTPRLLSEVVALNNSMPPASPRYSTSVPRIIKSKGTPGVIIGKKTPASNTKIARQ